MVMWLGVREVKWYLECGGIFKKNFREFVSNIYGFLEEIGGE